MTDIKDITEAYKRGKTAGMIDAVLIVLESTHSMKVVPKEVWDIYDKLSPKVKEYLSEEKV